MEIKPFNLLMYIGVALCLVQLSVGLDRSRYTKLSKAVGKRLKSYDPKKSPGYPQDYGYGYYYQGDILLRPNAGGRFAINELESNMWPNATVPYVIDANFTAGELQTLLDAFAQFENRTCIRFVPHTDEPQYVNITNTPEGCVSDVGRVSLPNRNLINLQTPQCMWVIGTSVHELMHTLGFYHEHSRPDRDEYIILLLNNLAPEHKNAGFINTNLNKYTLADGTSYGVPYNYGSVMHYARDSFAVRPGVPVMTNKRPYVGEFGSIDGLTEGDVAQLMARYCRP